MREVFRKDVFMITMKEGQNLRRLFDTFYLNKIAQGKQVEEINNYSYTPKIGKSIKKLTSKLRERDI